MIWKIKVKISRALLFLSCWVADGIVVTIDAKKGQEGGRGVSATSFQMFYPLSQMFEIDWEKREILQRKK